MWFYQYSSISFLSRPILLPSILRRLLPGLFVALPLFELSGTDSLIPDMLNILRRYTDGIMHVVVSSFHESHYTEIFQLELFITNSLCSWYWLCEIISRLENDKLFCKVQHLVCLHKSFPVAVWFSDLSSWGVVGYDLWSWPFPLHCLSVLSGNLGLNSTRLSNNDANIMYLL